MGYKKLIFNSKRVSDYEIKIKRKKSIRKEFFFMIFFYEKVH